MTIFEYERWSHGAHAYSKLGAEVIRRPRESGTDLIEKEAVRIATEGTLEPV